eukprot:CAMPEP_0172698974 /NCGR_PEP_ID=MMETSP1074-20121228/29839_1 /TAXON_ID=2916 /ORGANISM="Ceratium fusus, Strain PA161109" /LENGTH=1280 /DNA_ID=CAMNT_0013520087 /DNA_START=41 /DNA_END=3884 /DNA_ORIENTATION=+
MERGLLPSPFDFTDVEGLLHLTASNPLTATGVEETADGEEGIAHAIDLAAEVKTLPMHAHELLWQQVLAVADGHLSAERLVGNEDEMDMTSARVVHAVAQLLDAFSKGALDSSKNMKLPDSFTRCATLCQEMLLSIPNGHTQALIASALEWICVHDFEGREDFYGGVLMFLIGKCLSPKIAAADVNRLWKVSDLLSELDWEHETINSLKMQLLLCARSHTFMRSQHGPDLLCLFYTVHPGFTSEVHSTIKSQAASSRPNTLRAYGLGLFKAWKLSQAGTRVQVESCLQDWVSLALKTARRSADSARALLEEFHRHHHEEEVNELLCRLYGPLLWRSLKVANSQVRENAAKLLQYAFPLLPKELGVADREQELNKQLRLIRDALEDPNEPVRRVTVSALCVILKNYWEMLPTSEIAELLTVLMNQCARDKKAPMVRAAVAEGLSWVLENVLSHPTMGAVLPNLTDLLNDRSPIVRAAFVKLLQVVSQCRVLNVNNFVNHEQLLLRLASEHTEGQAERLQKGGCKKGAAAGEMRATADNVAQQLAKLLAPSIFSQDIVQQVERCKYLMQKWPLALLALLSHLGDITLPSDRVKLAAALFRYGLRDVTGAVSGSSSGAEGQPQGVATMLRVVGVLLEGGVAEPTKKNKKKVASSRGKLPKELEKFVYQHICEEDFMHLLRASHEGSVVSHRILDDLFFALTPLDPARLPQTAELVRHELTMVCRGGAALASPQRLTVLLRTAVRWNILDGCLEAAWERLLAASGRLKQRQSSTDDTENAVAVVEATIRDPEVRSAVLPQHATVLTQIVQSVSDAFCVSWSKGLTELGQTTNGREPLLLGPSWSLWPRVLGLVVRIALHLEYRVASSADQGRKPLKQLEDKQDPADENPQSDVHIMDGALETQAPDIHMKSSDTGRAEKTLEQLGHVLADGVSIKALEAFEAVVATSLSTGSAVPPAKRSKGIVLPQDIDTVLQVYMRLLESFNAANFLSVLKRNASNSCEGAALLIARELEECLWRWAAIADSLASRNNDLDLPRLGHVWVSIGRMLQQMAHTEAPTPYVVEAARRLWLRVDETTPAQDADLRRVMHALFSCMQFEPQLVQLVASIIGPQNPAETLPQQLTTAKGDAPLLEVHPRVRSMVLTLIPSFRNLSERLGSKDHGEPEHAEQTQTLDGSNRQRLLATPTPQKSGAGAAAAGPEVLSRPVRTSELRGFACPDSPSRLSGRSWSVRSRSPPPPMPDVTDEEMDDLQLSALMIQSNWERGGVEGCMMSCTWKAATCAVFFA